MKVRCIDNRPYLTPNRLGVFVVEPQEGELIDLTPGKVYEVMEIERDGFYRLIDNTGEDYEFPAYMFEPIETEQLCPPWSELFPVKIGPHLKSAGVLINDPILGEWWTIFNDPDKGSLYTRLWEELFELCAQQSRSPSREDIHIFAKSVEALLK